MSFSEWEKESKALVDELEDFAYNYKCEKCSEFYCSHMLRARAKKFGGRINGNLTGLAELASE